MQSSTEYLGPKVADVLHFLSSDAGVLLLSYLRQARPPLNTASNIDGAALAGARCEGWENCLAAIENIRTPPEEESQEPYYPDIHSYRPAA